MNEVRSPEQIERQINELRLQISHTLDAMEDKLSPGQLLDQALSYAKESTGAFAGNFSQSIRDHPLPATLLGVSLAWLMLAGNRTAQRSGGSAMPRRGDGRLRTVASAAQSASEQVRGSFDETREQMRETLDDTRVRARDTFENASDRIADAADRARDGIGMVTERLRDAGDSAKMGVVRTRAGVVRTAEATSEFVRSNPLAFAAIALAAGAVVAALVPRTPREDELMGEMSDELVGRVGEAAAAGAEQGIDAAARVADTALDVAEEELGTSR